MKIQKELKYNFIIKFKEKTIFYKFINMQLFNLLLNLLICIFPIINSKENKINMTILGTGKSISIINPSYTQLPNKIIIDGKEESFTNSNMQLTNMTHIIILIWNSQVNTAESMFYNCKQITKLYFDDFDTSSITNMAHMFDNCKYLILLDLKNFKTSNVQDMSYMFNGCNTLSSLILKNFDTSEVTNMSYMFCKCSAITSLDLSSFIILKVTNMENIFSSCSKIRFLDLSNFEPIKVTSLKYAFDSMSNLISIDLSNFKTPKLVNIAYMFYKTKKLISLDMSLSNFSHVINIENAFNDMNSYLKFCLNKTSNTMPETVYKPVRNQQLKGKIETCTDDCFTKEVNKFIIINKYGTCIDKCNSTYQYDYYNECAKSCPSGTRSSLNNEYICIDKITCEKYYNYDMTECIDEIQEGYYLNNKTLKTVDKCDETCKSCSFESMEQHFCIECKTDEGYYPMSDEILNEFYECYKDIEDKYYLEDNIYYPCYESYQKCSGGGDKNNHLCITCIEGYKKFGTNCYEDCQYLYYFDSNNIYHCTDDNQCLDNYKLIEDEKKCIDSCQNDAKYKFEYNNACYEECPQGYHTDEDNKCIIDLICEHYYNYTHTGCVDSIPEGYYCNDTEAKTIDKCDIKCKECTMESTQNKLCVSCNNAQFYYQKNDDEININNYLRCYKDILEGYYLDNDIFMPCYKSCKTCNSLGNITYHNCKTCNEDSTLNNTNCYEICPYYYYFDESYNYYCTMENKCPNKYSKLILDKNECVESCINEFPYEYKNECYKSCPKETYYDYSHTTCIDSIPDKFYCNDTNKKTIDKCDIKCQKCDLDSTNKQLCILCNNEENYYLKENDNSNFNEYINCYKTTPEGYYFDDKNKKFNQCYKTCKTCEELGQLTNQKCTSCFSNFTLNNSNCYEICPYHYYFDEEFNYYCTKEDKCPNEYSKLIVDNNECVESCTEEFKYEFNNKCYKFCPNRTYYNYTHTGCIDEIPLGYYINNFDERTIDKCNIKCKNCSLESLNSESESELCISCNEEQNFYPKYKDILNNINN